MFEDWFNLNKIQTPFRLPLTDFGEVKDFNLGPKLLAQFKNLKGYTKMVFKSIQIETGDLISELSFQDTAKLYFL